jgi:choline dehydrogenase
LSASSVFSGSCAPERDKGFNAVTMRDCGRFDYVIVGAGSAGCVLANRLSTDPQARVLLLESGGRDWHPWIHIPVGYLYTRNSPRLGWGLRTQPEKHLDGRALDYPRGRVLGGSSAINGMVYVRGHAKDYDTWRQLGNVGWSWDDVLPYFRKSEKYAGGDTPAHGVLGEWHVEERRYPWEILEVIRDACASLGIPRTDDFNTGESEGTGYSNQPAQRLACERRDCVSASSAATAEPGCDDGCRGAAHPLRRAASGGH